MKILSLAKLVCAGLLFVASTSLSAQPKGQWAVVRSKDKIAPRSECSLAAVNHSLYLIGDDGPAEPVERFDPAMGLWTKLATTPVVMHHFQAVSYKDDIYVLAAFDRGAFPDQLPMAHAYRYHTANNTWEALTGLPAGRNRAGAGAAEYACKLYLVGGIIHGHSTGTTNMFDVYDPATDTWTALPDAPHIRDHSSAVVIGDKLYAIGGRNTSYHEDQNFMAFFSKTVLEADCFDFKTGQWSTLPARLPLGTGGGTAVNLDGKLFYIGGERATSSSPNGPQKDVYYLDPSTDTNWNKAADVNLARNGVGGSVLDHKIYIAGGTGGGPGGPPPNGQRPPGPPPHDANEKDKQKSPMPPPHQPQGDISLEVLSFNTPLSILIRRLLCAY